VIELLALDVDGTLIDETMTIRNRVRQAVSKAQERGVTVTLATGRMPEATVPFALDLEIEAPLICYQGGLIQAPDTEEPLYRAMMDPEVVRDVLAWNAEHGWDIVLYADDALFIAERRYPESFYRNLLGENLHWADDLVSVLDQHKPAKFLFIAEPTQADRIEAALRQRFEGQMEVVRSHANFVEGNPLGVSKGDALRRLADHLGILQKRVMAIGDQGNDVAMIAWAGVGVAMGNATPATKAVADWIAPPLSEDGAAVAIEHFILRPS
jgi:Cof subfamily protein (haloacid dehalogenase superfamily)